MLALSGCQPSNTAETATSRLPSASPVVLASTPASSPSPTPVPRLSIDKVGAVATPGGFLAFALISNPSTIRATNVGIAMAALGAGGQSLFRRSGSLASIGPGQQAALGLAFPAGRALPSRFTADVTHVQWNSTDAGAGAQVAAATFLQDARTPTVLVHVIDRAPTAVHVSITTLCWDGAGQIRGGGSGTMTIGPDPQGKNLNIPVALSAVPARCTGYSVTLS